MKELSVIELRVALGDFEMIKAARMLKTLTTPWCRQNKIQFINLNMSHFNQTENNEGLTDWFTNKSSSK